MSRVFEARYRGRCAADCGEPIVPGDDVTYVDKELVHAHPCADDIEHFGGAEPWSPDVCPSCWLVKPCDCEAA